MKLSPDIIPMQSANITDMSKYPTKTLLATLGLVVAFISGWLLGQGYCPTPKVVHPPSQLVTESPESAFIVMVDDGQSVVTLTEVSVSTPETSLFEALKTDGRLDLQYQEYDGLGIFLQKINGQPVESSGSWWQFWVNGEYSQVGLSAYQPQPGDVVLLKLTGNQIQ